ncbi:MAG: hypothetical protein P8008_01160, partial [Gammaproteobacteria bacterium]
ALDGVRTVGLQQWRGGEVASIGAVPRAPMYYLALCARRPEALPALDADLWLFDDDAESVYAHYHGEIRRNMAAGSIIAERDREIEQLRRRLAETAEHAQPDGHSPGRWLPRWIARWFGRAP